MINDIGFKTKKWDDQNCVIFSPIFQSVTLTVSLVMLGHISVLLLQLTAAIDRGVIVIGGTTSIPDYANIVAIAMVDHNRCKFNPRSTYR